ncbi:helix-turn-helix transcriptional regulator [Ferruginibacter sp.]
MQNYFSQNLQILRKLVGKSQTTIAKHTGFTRTQWSNWESGLSTPTLQDALTLAKYFGVTLTTLIEIDHTQNAWLMERVGTIRYTFKKPKPDESKEPANSADLDEYLNVLNDPQAPYETAIDALKKRLEEKEEIIGALRGQVDALKLATTQMELRLGGNGK